MRRSRGGGDPGRRSSDWWHRASTGDECPRVASDGTAYYATGARCAYAAAATGGTRAELLQGASPFPQFILPVCALNAVLHAVSRCLLKSCSPMHIGGDGDNLTTCIEFCSVPFQTPVLLLFCRKL